ncbi:MAG: hypothetical protein AAFZ07_21675 [Actinomycetota bacterium]
MDRRRLGEVALVVAVVVATVSVFSTWTTSGRRDRNGVATLESLDALDLLASPWDVVLVVVTASIPLFLALAAAGFGFGRRALVAFGAMAAAVVLAAWAIVVLRSPLTATPGPQLALVATCALGVTVWASARAQRPRN